MTAITLLLSEQFVNSDADANVFRIEAYQSRQIKHAEVFGQPAAVQIKIDLKVDAGIIVRPSGAGQHS